MIYENGEQKVTVVVKKTVGPGQIIKLANDLRRKAAEANWQCRNGRKKDAAR